MNRCVACGCDTANVRLLLSLVRHLANRIERDLPRTGPIPSSTPCMNVPDQNSQDTSIPLLSNVNESSEREAPTSPDSFMIPETSELSNESLVGNAPMPSPSLSRQSHNSSPNDDPSLCQPLNNNSIGKSSLDNVWFSKYEEAMAICGPGSAKVAVAKRFHQEVYGAAADAQYRKHALAARLHNKYPKKDRRERNNNNSDYWSSDEELLAIPSTPLSLPVDPPYNNNDNAHPNNPLPATGRNPRI